MIMAKRMGCSTFGPLHMAPPLLCRDLKAGDIMVQESMNNAVGKVIAFGQSKFGQANSNFVHAGIMYDSTYVLEALGAGIVSNDIRVGTRACGYSVFRPKNQQLATIAANFGKLLFDSHGARHKLKYSVVGAIKSLGSEKSPKTTSEVDRLVDKIFGSTGKSFFCSQFVVVTYQIAGGQIGIAPAAVFPLDDGAISPARLETRLQSSRVFDQVGVMEPNKR
jgi:hypothetical protein